jgi:hypothetical protein
VNIRNRREFLQPLAGVVDVHCRAPFGREVAEVILDMVGQWPCLRFRVLVDQVGLAALLPLLEFGEGLLSASLVSVARRAPAPVAAFAPVQLPYAAAFLKPCHRSTSNSSMP